MDIKFLLVTLPVVLVIIACKAVNKEKISTNSTVTENFSEFPGALYPIAVKGKWGYMNYKMETIIKPQFVMAEDFKKDSRL